MTSMKLTINISYLLIVSILPLLLGEEHPYPRCEWRKIEDCVTDISVYNIGNTSFEVFQLFPGNVKANVLYCDWIENSFECACPMFTCSPPVNDTFQAFKSSTGKCLSVTNLQLSYGKINRIQCTWKEYSNFSTQGRAGTSDRSNALSNDESSTSPSIVNKSSDEKRDEASSKEQSDNTKVWLPVIVTVAILIVAAAIVTVLFICWRRHLNANKESQKHKSDIARGKTKYKSDKNTKEKVGLV